MSSENSLWYRLGFALERTRQVPASGTRKLATLKERRPAGRAKGLPPAPAERPSADALVTSALVAVVAKALDLWRPARPIGVGELMRAGLSGAGAALAVEVLRPLLHRRAEAPSLDKNLAGRLAAGAGQGLVYGAVVEPRLVGPAPLKGALYGSAEFAVDPMGGVAKLLGPHAPLKRVPVLGSVLDDLAPEDRDYVEHVAFGVALAVIYASSRTRRGTAEDDGA